MRPLEILSKKGAVTVLERTGKKTMVAIQRSQGSILTLEGNTSKDQLLAELSRMVRNWPDIPAAK